jgi:hypothetical protein
MYVEGNTTNTKYISPDLLKRAISPDKANLKTFSNLKKNEQKSGNALVA